MRRALCNVLAAIAVCAWFVAAAPGDQPASRDFRQFRPSAHGFAFVNHFEGSPLPGALGMLGGIGRSAGAPTAFGLCGGMSFAAADFYLAGRPVPQRTTIPQRGEALFDYFQQRQMATFGPDMKLAARFGRWMSLPDDGALGIRVQTACELEGMLAALSRGEPVVLGLVFNRHATNTAARGPVGVPWDNHQVLAYDARRPDDAAPGPIELRIYDPNYPGNDGAIIRARAVIVGTTLAGPWGGVQVPILGTACERVVPGHRPTPIRGVFAMPYERRTPPEGL